jgi:hypothetical protein
MEAIHSDFRRGYWLATGIFLGLGLLGWRHGVAVAIALCAVQVAHFAYREPSLAALSVQVRVLYLALLLLGLWDPAGIVHHLQLAGVWANVLFEYCPAARLLSLMPWNRSAPLTAELIAWTLFSPPVAGSILDHVPPPARTTAADRRNPSLRGSPRPGARA